MKVAICMILMSFSALAQSIPLNNMDRESHFQAADEGAHSNRLGATFVGGMIGAGAGASLFIYALTQKPPPGWMIASGIVTTIGLSGLGAWAAHTIWGGRGTIWSAWLGSLAGVAAGGILAGIILGGETVYVEAQKLLGTMVPLDVVAPAVAGLALGAVVASLVEVAALDSTDNPGAFKEAGIGFTPVSGGAIASVGFRF